MIPKILCWLFGHILQTLIVDERNHYLQIIKSHWQWLEKCPRCGVKL